MLAEPQEATWDAINRTFAPFAGSCTYAIRAEMFFHLQAGAGRPLWSRVKNACYPGALAWRAWKAPSVPEKISRGYLFVSDYAAEAGFGSLKPLLASCPGPATVVINSQVQRIRGRELAGTSQLSLICADALARPHGPRWRQLWERSRQDFQALLEVAPGGLRPALEGCGGIARGLLVRAYLYQSLYDDVLSGGAWQAVITHNDFTALSYLAGESARRHGIPDFTLQHGFPSLEYFPASASHYLVWGVKFQQGMSRHKSSPRTEFIVSGAPRMDPLFAISEGQRKGARAKFLALGLAVEQQLNVLFLSQGHSPVFSAAEHRRIFDLVGGLGEEPGVRLLVRRHPQEKHGSKPGAGRLVPEKISLLECLLAADVVISVNSTAMLEAAVLGSPVVQIALPGTEARLGLLQFPEQVKDSAGVRLAFRRLGCEPERQSAVAAQAPLIEACLASPGRATAAVWREIVSRSGRRQPAAAEAITGGGCR